MVIHSIHDPVVLEVIAFREALSLAEDLLLQNFVVASDSKQVIGDIHSGYQGKHATLLMKLLRELPGLIVILLLKIESRIEMLIV